MIRTELLQRWTKERKVRQRLIELTKSYLNQSVDLTQSFTSHIQWTPQSQILENVIISGDRLYITDHNGVVNPTLSVEFK